jgi:hypothetical protein
MLDSLLKLIGGNKDKKFTKPNVEETISTIKVENKKIKASSLYGEFIGDFKYPDEKKEGVKGKKDKKSFVPMEMTQKNKDLLKTSIVISLYDFEVERIDLEFIGNSIINGRPIYRYIGNDFSKFDLPYEELVSLDNYKGIPNTDVSKEYADYLSEMVDKSISYSEYVADSIKNVKQYI